MTEDVNKIVPEGTNEVQDTKPAPLLEVGNKDEKSTYAAEPIKITKKDFSNLKKSKYDEVRNKFKTVFVLQHRKFPEKIVELRAASPVHACNMIHWKPQQVRLLETRTVETEDVVDNIQNIIKDNMGFEKSFPSLL